MSANSFKFKQFVIEQGSCAMKVGVDGVLLGGWADVSGDIRVLDIGTGTGLIALMLAQKSIGLIDAVELDNSAALQAIQNFKASKWAGRLSCINTSIQKFAVEQNKKYDYIISNPPFFTSKTKSSDRQRARARHADDLPLKSLVEVVGVLLAKAGRFGVILPYYKRSEFVAQISGNGLWIHREARLKHSPDSKFERVLFEVSSEMPENFTVEEIVLEEGERHKYSKSFIKYTKDYYLD